MSLTSGMRQLQNNSIDLKNVWIFSSPPFSRHLISHAMLFEPFALYGMVIS
jgi:hypothetical protein